MRFWEISRQVGGFAHFFCSSRKLEKWSNLTLWLIFLRWVESTNLPFVDTSPHPQRESWKLARRIWSSRPGQRNSALVSNAPWKWQKGEGIPPNGGEKFSGIHPEDALDSNLGVAVFCTEYVYKVGCVFCSQRKVCCDEKQHYNLEFCCESFGNSLRWLFFQEPLTKWWFWQSYDTLDVGWMLPLQRSQYTPRDPSWGFGLPFSGFARGCLGSCSIWVCCKNLDP